MNEAYLNIESETVSYRYNHLNPERLTLFFVHGLGDSSLSFEDAFKYDFWADHNIIITDLIGYGRSSKAAKLERYHYEAHAKRLWTLIAKLRLKQIILLGHSMGGDIGTLMCRENRGGVIRKFVNIEGDITQHDLFISGRAVKANNEGKFESWFEDYFKYELLFKKFGHKRSSRLYFASLNFCRPEAFLENSIELVRRNTSIEGEFQSEIGKIYSQLTLPRVYCYGTVSCSKYTLQFLRQNNLELRKFEGAGHSLMVDSADEFYQFVSEFIKA